MNTLEQPPTFPPARAAALQATGPAEGSGPSTGGDKTSILVVDDLPEKLLVFGTVLEDLGHELVFVRSGREALRAVLHHEFAVILLDVNMPDIDGFETARLIRQYRRSAHTPIIFITSYTDELQTARGYSVGAVDYILSPVVPHVLRSKVQVFAQLFQLQRQIRRQGDAQAAFVAAEAARRAAEANDRRSAFLSEASRVLNRSLQLDVSVHDLAALVVPRLAPLAVVMLSEGDTPSGHALLAVQSPLDGAPVSVTSALQSDLSPVVRAALHGAMRERRRREITDVQLVELNATAVVTSPSGAGVSTAQALPRWQAASAVPLVSGDRLLGAIFTTVPTGGVAGGGFDLHLIDDLATLAAAALENARLYGSLQSEIVERRFAETQLLESSRRKDEFLAMLSHELRNPLAPIRTALEVIRRLAPAEPKITWSLDVMVRQLRQMTRLIDELLDVARISQGKIVLTRERVDLNDVISQSVETAQPLMDSREQVLEVVPFAEPMWLHGDFARLAQIVSNLLNNACKYSERGTRIRLAATLDAQGALIRVRDQGIGIDPQLLPRVFDLFTQGGRGLDRTQGGLGVGLTLARRLAELHGGSIQAASEGVGRGSEFTLRLPCLGLVRGGPELATPREPPKDCTLHRVLVVDDNRDAAQSTAAFLRLEGHEVRTAGDGVEALEVAAVFAPDVVLLDIGLPLLDGYEVARRLREAATTRRALMVALTGYGREQDRQSADSASFDHHFVKPVDPAVLLECIQVWGGRSTSGGSASRSANDEGR